MNRPRIFVSAVSAELLTTRRAVAATIRTLGFDPVSQDDFPTGYGELRQWLREQIDTCEGLVQIIGQTYGAEPPAVDPSYGRISYTQFEFLYASEQRKKTWVIIAGDPCHRDKPVAELDLPEDLRHPDPAGYQAERRQLQNHYLERLKLENHLWHSVASDPEIQNVVLRLRNELGALRERTERHQRRLARAVTAVLAGLLLLAAGGWQAYHRLHKEVREAGVVDTAKIRSHLLKTVEETHRRELAGAETVADWKDRQRFREAAEAAHAGRLARIDELAASFAEIEGRGQTTGVFQEMTRILSEQGVDEAIAFVASRRGSILKKVQARTAAARERNRAELQTLLKTAALHEQKSQSTEADSLYGEILAAEPDWPEALHAAVWFHVNQGNTASTYTTSEAANRQFGEAYRLSQRLVSVNSTNLNWQRDLAVSLNNVGKVRRSQGDLAGALESYQESLDIMRKLAAQDAKNAGWQRDLMVSLDRIGDVRQAQADLAGALESYRESLDIMRNLTAQDVKNAGWQRDLAVSLNNVGKVRRSQGDLAGALESYRESLDIMRKLTAQDAKNAGWQRDLTESLDNVGDVRQAQGDLAGALESHQESLDIMRKLTEQDAKNAGWHRDLAVSLNNVGKVRRSQGDLAGALESYQESLDIMRKLAAQDAKNASWQFNLTVSLNKVGEVRQAQGDLAGALESYRESLDIMRKLTAQDAKNAGWQRNLSVSLDNVGDVRQAQADLVGALESYRESLDIMRKLTAQDAKHAGWQRDLTMCLDRIGDVRQTQGDLAGALESYRESLDIRRKLTAQDAKNAGWRRSLCVSLKKMALLAKKRKAWREAREWFLEELTTADHLFENSVAAEAGQFRANILRPLVECDLALKDPASALSHQTRLVELCRKIKKPLELAEALNTQAGMFAQLGRYPEACEAARESLTFAAKASNVNEQWLSDANGNFCWFGTLSGRHTEALPAGEKAVALLKDDQPCAARLNLAHSRLFNGQFEKAKAIYTQYLGQAFRDGRQWNDKLRHDFKLFRESGITHPDLAKIEALLK